MDVVTVRRDEIIKGCPRPSLNDSQVRIGAEIEVCLIKFEVDGSRFQLKVTSAECNKVLQKKLESLPKDVRDYLSDHISSNSP